LHTLNVIQKNGISQVCLIKDSFTQRKDRKAKNPHRYWCTTCSLY